MTSSFSNSRLLAIWEQATPLPPARRSLCLLAGFSATSDCVGQMSVGQRDRRLLLLRKQLFGDAVEGVTDCPKCGVRVELGFSIGNLPGEITTSVPETLHLDGYTIRWRLPTSQDMADLAIETVPLRIRQALLERCLLEVRHHESVVDPIVGCPEMVIDKVCEAMSLADPYGVTRLEMICPECSYTWQAVFDIGTYLWREIDVWAKRLLGEVHQLAVAYGWGEKDILEMSTQRRRMYLEMVGT